MRSFRAVPEDSKWKVSKGTATFLSGEFPLVFGGCPAESAADFIGAAGGMASNFFWIGSFPFDSIKKYVFGIAMTKLRRLISLALLAAE